jgi:hypothetical protein
MAAKTIGLSCDSMQAGHNHTCNFNIPPLPDGYSYGLESHAKGVVAWPAGPERAGHSGASDSSVEASKVAPWNSPLVVLVAAHRKRLGTAEHQS